MIDAIVLAAGASTRMGRPKAALRLSDAGDTFLSRLCSTLIEAGVPRVTIVTGAHHASLDRSALHDDARVRVVHNPQWPLGQLSSLLTGLHAIDDGQLEAMLVGLVDIPLVRATTVRALIERWRETRAPIVRPSRNGAHGHPVIFDRAIFDELRAADLTRGAKSVVHAHRDRIIDLPVDDEGAFLDADTEDEYQRLLRIAATIAPNPSRTLE